MKKKKKSEEEEATSNKFFQQDRSSKTEKGKTNLLKHSQQRKIPHPTCTRALMVIKPNRRLTAVVRGTRRKTQKWRKGPLGTLNTVSFAHVEVLSPLHDGSNS